MTSRYHDHTPDQTAPFDHEVDAKSDLDHEFWGATDQWSAVAPTSARRTKRLDDTTGSMRAIRDGVAAFRPRRVESRDQTGQLRRTRSHGVVAATPQPTMSQRRTTASIGELASGHYDEPPARTPFEADHRPDDLPLTPVQPARLGLGAVDPLLARLGALVLVGVLLVPVALALRPSSAAPDTVQLDAPTDAPQSAAGAGLVESASPTAAVEFPTVAVAATDTTTTSDSAAAGAAAVSSAPSSSESAASTSEALAAAAPATDAPLKATAAIGDDSVDDGLAEPATVDATAERVVPECPQTYTAGPGDSWYGIAERADVAPSSLMAENRATVDTVIFSGDEICLPSGAKVPAPMPTTTSPPVTTAPSGTTAPTTTDAPTTTVAPSAPASVEEVKELIRQTWPADQHEMALFIADRESRFDPLADNNFCCYGVFQMYFEVHKGWLDDFGVYTASDLFDAEKNINAAYHLYERAGGWGPWGF